MIKNIYIQTSRQSSQNNIGKVRTMVEECPQLLIKRLFIYMIEFKTNWRWFILDILTAFLEDFETYEWLFGVDLFDNFLSSIPNYFLFENLQQT